MKPTSRPKTETALPVEEASNLDTLLDSIFDGGYLVDRQRRIKIWNAGATALTGFSSDEILQRACHDNILLHVDEDGNELCKSGCPLQKTMEDAQPRQATLYLRHKLGYRVPIVMRTVPIFDEDGKVTGAVETFREIEEASHWRVRLAELEKLAFVDLVTGIPNRHFLESQLERLLREYQTVGEPFTMCMLDVDRFKATNDRYGHEVGDRVLRSLGQSLLNCLRDSDMLGRWGGDEFVLLLPKTQVERAKQVVERSRMVIAETVTAIGTDYLKATVSIGASVISAGTNRAALIKRVDEQLYMAKGRGRNCWSVV